MSGLKLSFLISDYGPRVIAQLQREASYRATFSVKSQGVIERWSKDSHTTPQDIKMVMEEFIALALPERKGAIAKWVFDAYLNGTHNGKQILAEDLYKIKEDLQYFDALKKSDAFDGETDLLKYQSLAQLRETLAPYEQVKRRKDAQRAERSISDEVKADILKETTVLYDGPEGRVVMPHTIKASKYWGNHTKWCISGETTADQFFHSHNQQSAILMIIPKGGEDDKLAIVANTFWNAADDQLEEIPARYQHIINAMLDNSPLNVKPHLENLLEAGKSPVKRQMPNLDKYPAEWQETFAFYERERPDTTLEKDKKLFGNPDFVLDVVKYNPDMLRYASPTLKADRKIVLAAIAKKPSNLYLVAPKFRADREIVHFAVERDGCVQKPASDELKEDPEIVLAAVRQDGCAFQYARRLRSDPDFVLKVLGVDGKAFQYVDSRLKSNPEFIKRAVKSYGMVLRSLDKNLRADREIVTLALKQDSKVWYYLPRELTRNKDFVQEMFEMLPRLPLDIGGWTTIHEARTLPSREIMEKAKKQNLIKLMAEGDQNFCRKHTRYMPELWGDAEMVFGTNPDKIRKALQVNAKGPRKATPALQ